MSTIKSPYRNKMMTPAKVQGRITLDLIRYFLREQIRFNSNVYLGSAVTTPSPIDSGSSPWTATPAMQYTEITLTTITADAEDYNVILSAKQPNGNPFSLAPSHQDGVNGEVFWQWYKDQVTNDLIVRIWNGREDLEMKAWYNN